MSGGYARIHRRLYENPVFRDFQEASVFAWMVTQAAWKPMRVRYKERIIELARGQLAMSNRDMANRIGWTEARVRRFLNRLKIDAVIDAATDAGVNVITLCKYDEYQAPIADDDAGATQQATQERRTIDAQKKEGKEKKERRDTPLPPQPNGTRLAADWNPDPAGWQYAADRGYDADQIDALAEDFREYFTGPDARQPVKRDWSRAWQRWVRKDRERGDPAARRRAGGAGRTAGGGGSRPQSVVRTILETSAEIAARQRGSAAGDDDPGRAGCWYDDAGAGGGEADVSTGPARVHRERDREDLGRDGGATAGRSRRADGGDGVSGVVIDLSPRRDRGGVSRLEEHGEMASDAGRNPAALLV